MMTVPSSDADRVRRDYTDADDLTRDDIEDDLRDADFDGDAAEAFADAIAADQGMPASDRALQDAQRELVSSTKSGGALGSQVVQGAATETHPGDAEAGQNITIGTAQNVETEIRRSGSRTGDVIAKNRNTGSEAKVGTVELVDSSRGSVAER
jgi:hypothetical protein